MSPVWTAFACGVGLGGMLVGAIAYIVIAWRDSSPGADLTIDQPTPTIDLAGARLQANLRDDLRGRLNNGKRAAEKQRIEVRR